MLVSNLERQGVDLSIETDLLYLDVTNGLIGVKTTSPSAELDVNGAVKATSATVGNLLLSGNTLGVVGTNANLSLDANGTGYVVFSDTTGFVMPTGPTDSRPLAPVEGTFRYNNELKYPEFFDGTDWVVAGPSSNEIELATFHGDGSTTTFTLPRASETNSVFVTINGTLQEPILSYLVLSTLLTFTEPPAQGDRIDVRIFSVLTIGIQEGSGSGITVSNDTTTNSSFYLTFTSSDTGTLSNVSVSSSKLYFNPSTGQLNATEFNSLSDVTVKSDIVPIEDALGIVKQLDGFRFTWKDTGKHSIGVSAQNVEVILPELVSDLGYKTVNYSGLIPVLIQAIKELDNRLKEFERRRDV